MGKMREKNLRRKLIRLAQEKPELRGDLLPLLKRGKRASMGDEEDPEAYYFLVMHALEPYFEKEIPSFVRKADEFDRRMGVYHVINAVVKDIDALESSSDPLVKKALRQYDHADGDYLSAKLEAQSAWNKLVTSVEHLVATVIARTDLSNLKRYR